MSLRRETFFIPRTYQVFPCVVEDDLLDGATGKMREKDVCVIIFEKYCEVL